MRLALHLLVVVVAYALIGWGGEQFHRGMGALLVGALLWLDLFLYPRR